MTALAAVGPLLFAADGPLLHIYTRQISKGFNFLGARRIFKEHAIHGIATLQHASGIILAIWGGSLVRFVRLQSSPSTAAVDSALVGNAQLSLPIRAADWILDLSFGTEPHEKGCAGTIAVSAAVTAHNSLVEITLEDCNDGLAPHITELTPSSKTILYSAHLQWDSAEHILVAAGTAFGEIMYWSWARNREPGALARIHRVFLGHEGSIFSVQISKEIDIGSGRTHRFLASCSDDRTIRVWNVSGISMMFAGANDDSRLTESERTRHTGFSNADLESDASESPCLAIGWGHLSRVWAVQFLDAEAPSSSITLVSSGEDATSRMWQFKVPEGALAGDSAAIPLKLKQLGTAAYHSGKNIWSSAILRSRSNDRHIVTGGADSKICAYKLPASVLGEKNQTNTSEYTLQEISQACPAATREKGTSKTKGCRPKDFLRSYAFIDASSFILSTNSGNVFLQTLGDTHEGDRATAISHSELIAQLEDIGRYSLCAGDPALAVGFVAGSNGNIYMYRKGFSLVKVHTATGKVGTLFIGKRGSERMPGAGKIVLLVTCMGQSGGELVYINPCVEVQHVTPITVKVALPEGDAVTSMAYLSTGTPHHECLIVGFRSGAIAGYRVGGESLSGSSLSPVQIFNQKIHGKEAVTSLLWYPSAPASSEGHLVSGGRDGCCATHHVDLSTAGISLVSHLPLAIGPNIEGLYDHDGQLMMYGFSSSKFILYNVTKEEEVMNVDTGGSRRSWTFRPDLSQAGGGTLVWTQATSMHIHSQEGPNHQVIRAGGHGREIKTVAVSNGVNEKAPRRLIATGAEDTDIKIFDYADGDLVCRKTLRKHVTGIQQLQWSDNGNYLFSSGGCEEFFVWRIRTLPPFMGIGVICESVCAPESDHADLRLTAFDTRREGSEYTIAMVFSDSSTRVCCCSHCRKTRH